MPYLDWGQAAITISPQPAEDRTAGVQVSVQIIYQMNSPSINIPFVISEGGLVLLPPITLQATSRMRLD
jgi:hypothetical protein